jgi:hypothetical protein
MSVFYPKPFMYRLIVLVALFIIAYEFKIVFYDRAKRRKDMFAKALAAKNRTGKPIMVIGDPATDNYSLTKFDYGCGDLCVDINGCPNCANAQTRDINYGFSDFADNSHVVFVSCTLEYSNDIYSVYDELMRISGGDLFIVAIEPNSIKTNLARNLGYSQFNRKWRIHSLPNINTLIAEPF